MILFSLAKFIVKVTPIFASFVYVYFRFNIQWWIAAIIAVVFYILYLALNILLVTWRPKVYPYLCIADFGLLGLATSASYGKSPVFFVWTIVFLIVNLIIDFLNNFIYKKFN